MENKNENSNIVYLFEFDNSMDDNYMNYSSQIYFNENTKQFIFRRIVSYTPGFSCGGHGIIEEYEVTYEYVLGILGNMLLVDDDIKNDDYLMSIIQRDIDNIKRKTEDYFNT